ncbi:MAG: ATP-dependent exoDNAse (exonuclease V) alpha subunit [Arenicella sp.]|jgi:exodeoxyribonuclease-5
MSKPSELMETEFPFTPTQSQKQLFEMMDNFISDTKTARNTFVLKGYAGTGKTSIVSALVKVLPKFDYSFVLLAPTGRAAKVMSVYAQKKAFTIHKIIFKAKEDSKTGKMSFKRMKNTAKNTIYLIDEASMINNFSEYGNDSLLRNLISFVFEEYFSGNKIMFIGDTAQLPPVGQSVSPALDGIVLQHEFECSVIEHLLVDVVRQKEKSGVLENATAIRNQIARDEFKLKIQTSAYPDFYKMNSNRLEDGLRYAYDKYGIENTCIITRSNKSATMYNKFIRQQIHYREEEIEAGDFLMVVKNNYDWLPLDSKAGFLANGEYVEVMRILDTDEEAYGQRFATLSLRLVDYPGHDLFNAKVFLSTLHSITPALTQDEYRELQNNALLRYVEESTDRDEQMMLVKADEHLRALQVKYAYALTCHKSQGGQWNAVFIDLGYINDKMMDVEFLRWLYTAITRTTDEVFLVNFPKQFFA